LLDVGFIKFVEEATWLSPIVVVLKKNENLKNCVDFKKFNATTKIDPNSLLFSNEILNIVVGHEVYTFLDGFLGYHQISIALEDQYKTTFVIDWGGFCMGCNAFWGKKWTTYLTKGNH
jgi:hypothetical protein